MGRQGRSIGRDQGRRKASPRGRLVCLLAAALLPVATTSIARQDAMSLLPDSPDFVQVLGSGRYLAAVPHRMSELSSLEAADLYASGRGPMATPGLFDGGGSLMVLDLPEPEPENVAKADRPPPFVDRTIKGDRRPARPERAEPTEAARKAPDSPDAFAALPMIDAAFALDLTGLDMLPPTDAAIVMRPQLPVEAPPVAAIEPAASVPADAAEELVDAGLTAIPMTPRDGGWRHDGSTPAVAALGGGTLPQTTTPAGNSPLALAALPVTVRAGATPGARLRDRVALTPADASDGGGETTTARGKLGEEGVIETRLARRLAISEVQLVRSEQCLAEAIYFEARGETREGQYAVAQVVMNRTRSGYYPADVCGVVYQNKHRLNACQFSFACDRIPDRVTNRHAWNLAMSIARDVTRGGAWLPEVGDSTHYHATYVRPNWIRDMVKEDSIGRHIFYRVRWRAPLA